MVKMYDNGIKFIVEFQLLVNILIYWLNIVVEGSGKEGGDLYIY